MERKHLAILFVLQIALFLHVSSACADEPTLRKATFFSHTNDDDKDHDTGVYVTVMTSDGRSIIAHAGNRDSSTGYPDHSDHQFDLDLDNTNLKMSAAKNFKVHVWQRTNRHDTWKSNMRVVLYFSDGNNQSASRDGIELKNDGAGTELSGS